LKTLDNLQKKAIAITLFAASIGTASVAQAAGDKPWYVGVSVSQGDISDINSTSNEAVAGSTRAIDIDSDDDTGFGVKIGKVISKTGNGNEFSVELSYSELDNDLETLTFNGTAFAHCISLRQVVSTHISD